jgi:hypothetical protein
MLLTAQAPKITVNTFHFLSSFSIGRTIWKWYEGMAIRAFVRYKLKLETNTPLIKNISITVAKKELERVDRMVKFLEGTKKYFDLVRDEKHFVRFYTSFLEVYNLLLDIQEKLENKVYPHYYAQASEKALAKAWNSPEDDHWDNY